MIICVYAIYCIHCTYRQELSATFTVTSHRATKKSRLAALVCRPRSHFHRKVDVSSPQTRAYPNISKYRSHQVAYQIILIYYNIFNILVNIVLDDRMIQQRLRIFQHRTNPISWVPNRSLSVGSFRVRLRSYGKKFIANQLRLLGGTWKKSWSFVVNLCILKIWLTSFCNALPVWTQRST